MNTVLFLCTGNSCRSQMAEAIVNHDCSENWQAYSAGTLPAGFVNPYTLHVLREIGIEHEGRSKSIQEYYGKIFDLVITVCGDAEANCPIWLGHEKKVHIGFDDPARYTGTDEEKLNQFRLVRDRIRTRIVDYLQSIDENR
jgi:arsenate reductase (thioredoxin)